MAISKEELRAKRQAMAREMTKQRMEKRKTQKRGGRPRSTQAKTAQKRCSEPSTDLTIADRRKLVKRRQRAILEAYSQGKTHDQIAAEHGMTIGQVTRDLKYAIDTMIRFYASPTPYHSFVRYAAFQFGVIGKLNKVATRVMQHADPKSLSAAVQALKSQSDIYDKILEQGVDFNVIIKEKAKKPQTLLSKSTQDIRIQLKQEILSLSKLVSSIDSEIQQSKGPPGVNPILRRETYVVRIRNVQTNQWGVIRDDVDWKYRKRIIDPSNKRKEYQPNTAPQHLKHLSPLSAEDTSIHEPLNLSQSLKSTLLSDIQTQVTSLQKELPNPPQNPPHPPQLTPTYLVPPK